MHADEYVVVVEKLKLQKEKEELVKRKQMLLEKIRETEKEMKEMEIRQDECENKLRVFALDKMLEKASGKGPIAHHILHIWHGNDSDFRSPQHIRDKCVLVTRRFSLGPFTVKWDKSEPETRHCQMEKWIATSTISRQFYLLDFDRDWSWTLTFQWKDGETHTCKIRLPKPDFHHLRWEFTPTDDIFVGRATATFAVTCALYRT